VPSPVPHRRIIRMLCISAYSRLLKSIAAAMLLAGLTAAQAQTPAGQKRPAAVLRDYIITPFGYFYPSCVAHLAKRGVVRQDEVGIRHANGTSDNIHVRAYPHYKGDRGEVTRDERAVNQRTIDGWVELASPTTDPSYGYLYAHSKVPSAPSTGDRRVVLLFPAMEDINDPVTLIQPVLGWNFDYASAWGVGSWSCCVSGTVFEAAPAPVTPGAGICCRINSGCAGAEKTGFLQLSKNRGIHLSRLNTDKPERILGQI
jgi:hypothetical protein